MLKENMKNNGNLFYATGKQLDNKAMIFFLYRTNHYFFLKGVFLWFILDVFSNRAI